MNILHGVYSLFSSCFAPKHKKPKDKADIDIKQFEHDYVRCYENTAVELGYVSKRARHISSSSDEIVEKTDCVYRHNISENSSF